MAVRFSDEQVVKATGARRVRAGARTAYDAVSTDTRTLRSGSLFVALVGETHDAHAFLEQAAAAGASGALVQRGSPLPPTPEGFALFEVDDTLAALGALGRFHRLRFSLPIAAITGSNGKTTTKEMVGAILETRGHVLKTRGNLNNEIGVPQTLFELEPGHVAAVVEMGMNHAGEIARLTALVQPQAGLITIVQPAHLQGLGSIEGVASAKGELFMGLSPGATAVVNLDDARVAALPAAEGTRRLTFGRAKDAQVRLVQSIALGKEGLQLQISYEGAAYALRIAFFGDHNAVNATAAFALALALGYAPEECVRGLQAARPYARRLNVVEAPGGVTVLDDCYNANPASMNAGLQTLKDLSQNGRAVAVLGDMLELGSDEEKEHRAMVESASASTSLLAFFGPRFEAPARASGKAHFVEPGALVEWLRPQLRAGDVVLVKASRGMRLERVVEALTGRA